VHRVDAAVRQEQDNYVAAEDAYQAAIDLSPDWAPLRFWYALFLANRAGDTDGAQEQLAIGLEYDPRSVDLRLEHLRASIYLRDWSAAEESLEAVAPLSRELSGLKLRKFHDLTLQLHHRRADDSLEANQPRAALKQLSLLRGAYREVPSEALDERMGQKLTKAVPLIRRCVRELRDPAEKKLGAELASWMINEAAGWSDGSTDTEKDLGTLKSLRRDRGFGFLTDGLGTDRFFHFSDVEIGVDPYGLVEGTYVRYVPTKDAQGRARARAVEPTV
jgi:cold shock CspA family protein